jgi:hypothetical protein
MHCAGNNGTRESYADEKAAEEEAVMRKLMARMGALHIPTHALMERKR